MENQLITFETAKLAKSKGFTLLWDDTKQYRWDALNSQGLFEEQWYNEKGELDWILYLGEEGLDNYITKENIDTTYLAATQSFLQKWLREKHNIHIQTVCNNLQNLMFSSEGYYIGGEFVTKICETYEEALEIGLQTALHQI